MHKKLHNIYILVKVLGESFSFAFVSVKTNKLRTFLSLLGITIGIFSIISVFTMVDALESNVRNEIESLGSDVIYIQRWPWTEDNGEYKWWEFFRRPVNTYEEYTYLQNHSRNAQSMAFVIYFSRQLKYKNNTTSRVQIAGVTYEWDKIASFEVESGRYFSLMDVNSGSNVAIIGSTIAEELFGDDDPLGKYFQIAGRKTRIIGVLKKQGKSLLGLNNYDNSLMVPFPYARTMANIRRGDPTIVLKARNDVEIDDLRGEIRQMMRALRRLKPSQKDNFAVNELSAISQQLNPMLSVIHTAGWFIGGLAILVGGFGVANIMFVSVRERTQIIGIQKSLGAKNYFILAQFLYEAIWLTFMGGVLGLFIVFVATRIVTYGFDFPLALTLPNIVLGIFISAVVGVLSGIIPAYMASRLSPVVAIGAK